ncbi:EpsG family protein [Vibrio splendidus]|uniref:EpsG family protein n=1 Tax=Vibrio splendidus TaxID=29497 RepID=UPI00076A222F|nr:EpsG family protein [Vibrio splendidus]
MSEYLLTSLFLSLYLLLILQLRDKATWYDVLLVTLCLSYVIGFRSYDSGNDTVAYYSMFETMANVGYVDFFETYPRLSFEKLYWFEIYIYTLFTDDISIIMFLQTVTSVFLTLTAINLIAANGVLAVLLTISMFTFYSFFGNVIRHGGAIAFFLWSIYFSEKNNVNKAVISSFASMLFHAAGVFSFIPVIFSILKVRLSFVFVLAFSFVIFLVPFVNVLSSFSIFSALNYYFEGSSLSLNLSFSSIFSILLVALVLLFYPKLRSGLYFKVYLFLSIINLFDVIGGDASYRIEMTRYILEPIIISGALNLPKKYLFTIPLFTFSYFIYLVYFSNFMLMMS